jgi:hypothetical protein
VIFLKVVVNYPATDKGVEELKRSISLLHAQSIMEKLQSLNCPTKLKLQILDEVIEKIKNCDSVDT